jgi:hypothetical protein
MVNKFYATVNLKASGTQKWSLNVSNEINKMTIDFDF